LLSHDSEAGRKQQSDILERSIMVCAAKFVSPVFEPSPQQIKLMTAAIRKAWSPKVRAGRAVRGRKRVEIMMVSAEALFNAGGLDGHH
jgi:hypothetical protein